MDTSAGGDLTDVAATLRRRWRAVAACTAAGLMLAAAALLLVPRTYTSTAAVHVRPTGIPEITGERSGRTNGEVNLDTEAQIVQSAEVSAAVAERLGSGADPVELRRRVEVSVPPNSSVLQISYPGSDPQSARRASAAFADAYLGYRKDRVDRQIGDILSSLQDEVDTRYTELERIARGDGGAALQQGRITAVQNEIAELNKEIHPLTALRSSVAPARIITPANTPEEASSPVPVLWLAAGGVLGLTAGLAAAFGADRRDHRLHTVRETERAAGVPVL
ncbi:YveK family protein, partial [Streptomonospora algeriensis]